MPRRSSRHLSRQRSTKNKKSWKRSLLKGIVGLTTAGLTSRKAYDAYKRIRRFDYMFPDRKNASIYEKLKTIKSKKTNYLPHFRSR